MTSGISPDLMGSFAPRDVGLGTAYERLAIYRRILRWCDRTHPRSAAEGPLDGMAGMPGLHLLPLARQGIPVTVILPSREALNRVREIYSRAGLGDRLTTIESDVLPSGEKFDWVLAMNALPRAPDWRQHLGALARQARWLVLLVTHPWSYGTFIRRASRWVSGRRTHELFDHPATRMKTLTAELSAYGSVEDSAFVDCPWWPDLFVAPGETLAGSIGIDAPRRFVFDAESFPYASDPLPADLAARLRRHPHFESSRAAPVFAHHRAFLAKVNPHA